MKPAPPFSLVAVIAVLVTACAGPAPAPQPTTQEAKPVYGGTLNVMISNDPRDWDPNGEAKGNPGQRGLAQAYNSLLGYQWGPDIAFTDMRLRPELAERWEVAPDGKTVTFTLRKGVKYANVPPVNGRDLTAADVKWTAEYYTRSGEFKEKKLPQSRNEFMYQGMDRVEAPDPQTVRFYFKEPFAPFISYAASDWTPILAREIYDQDGSHTDRIVGTGAFQLEVSSSQKGTRWVWKKNPAYWEEGKPYLDEIRWIVVLNDATAQAAFQTKQIDYMYQVEHKEFQELIKAAPSAKYFKWLQPHAANLRLSAVQGQPTTDIRVRRAVNLALDRDEINKVFSGGEGVFALPGAMMGLFSEAEVKQMTRHDPEEAKRLLAQAGYASGLTLDLPTDDTRSQSEQTLYALFQAQLKKAGINLDWKIMTQAQQRQKRRAGDFGLDSTTGLSPLEADNDSILYAEFHSSLKGSTNNSHINDPELDKLLEASRREMNPEKRRELLRSTVRHIVDNVLYIGLIYPPKYEVYQPYVMSIYPQFGNKGVWVFSWLQK